MIFPFQKGGGFRFHVSFRGSKYLQKKVLFIERTATYISHIQPPPEKVFGPQQHTLNTLPGRTWTSRVYDRPDYGVVFTPAKNQK